jgi:3-dehydroquinate dehydratase
MGMKGKKSRIAGYRLGNALTYVALPGETLAAPGQLTFDDIKGVFLS